MICINSSLIRANSFFCMTYKDLIKLGLNEKEAKIYLASLELGETTIQNIAQKSGINRTSVYYVMGHLKEKGLARSLTKRKKTYYYAEDPRKIKEQFDEKNKTIENILPELLSIVNAIDKKPKIKFYEGVEGVKEIYKEILKYPEQEVISWISETAFFETYSDFFYDYFIPARKKKKIWTRAIIPDNKEMREYKNRETEELRKSKLIPAERYPIKASINLYGKNQISIIAFAEKIGLIIESEKIYITLKSIFEMNWEMLED